MTKLAKFQQQGVLTIEKHDGRCLLADDMGLGKTIQGLCYLKRHPKLRPAVVICPAFLKWVWEEQAKEHYSMNFTVCNGTRPPKKKNILTEKNKLIVINYEILIYWVPYLRSLCPKVFLLDESQYLMNPNTMRTKAVFKLCAPKITVPKNDYKLINQTTPKPWSAVLFKDRKNRTKKTGYLIEANKDGSATIREQPPHIIPISGTPITKRPAQFWPVLNLVWPHIFPSFPEFGWRYCNPKMGLNGWEFKGASNLAELHRILRRLGMIRRLKKDVLPQLDLGTPQMLPLPITNRDEYNRADKDFMNWRALYTKENNRRAKLQRAAKYKALRDLAVEGKLKYFYQWLDNFLDTTEEKIVLGCWHKKVIHEIHKKYHQHSLYYHGGMQRHEQKNIVRTFQTDKHKRILVAQIKAIGLGQTLTAANHIGFVELPFDPGDVTQFIDRIRRIGQKKRCNILYFIGTHTIEHLLCRVLQQSQKVLNQLLDGNENISGMNLDIYDMLEKEMRKR